MRGPYRMGRTIKIPLHSLVTIWVVARTTTTTTGVWVSSQREEGREARIAMQTKAREEPPWSLSVLYM